MFPRWLAVAAALSLIVIVLAGCGGSTKTTTVTTTVTPTNTAESPATTTANETAKSEASVEQIREKLTQALRLHTYAGSEDAFKLPESGKYCSITLIQVGKEAVQLYSEDKAVLVSPDKNAMVKVGHFQGTPPSDCLDAVRKALGW